MARAQTVTGGREATGGVIRGRWALSVGKHEGPAPNGFSWRLLTDMARLESGHTPGRKTPSYWGGDIPWIGVRDATGHHGLVIHSTRETVTAEGIANSSARVLPKGTVCLSRTASVGYVVMMGRPMATSQDFVNWVCGPDLNPHYLRYILMLEQESVRRFAHGTTHQTMYYPEAKALHVLVPMRALQDRIAGVLGALDDLIETNQRLAGNCEALASALALTADGQTPLHELAVSPKYRAVMPVGPTALYSLPAFDAGRLPEAVDGNQIKSSKTPISSPAVLVSRLNPHIPRVWMAFPEPGSLSVTSTEFVLFEGEAAAVEEVWALCANPEYVAQMMGLVTGTTGSHQRVDKDALLKLSVPDVRRLPTTTRSAIVECVQQAESAREEARVLRRTRDELLPLLLSGRVSVREVAA